jgi:hypothetical protein
VIAHLTRDQMSWGWASELVRVRIAGPPTVEEVLRSPLDELATALAP